MNVHHFSIPRGLRLALAAALLLAFGSCKSSTPFFFALPPEAGVAAALVFKRAPSAMEWQNQTWSTIEVQVVDGLGDPVTNATDLVELALMSGTGNFTGSMQTNAVGGIATFTGLSYSAAETIDIRFESGELDPTDTAEMLIELCIPGNPVKLGFGDELSSFEIQGDTWASFTVESQDCESSLVNTGSALVTLAAVGATGTLAGTLQQSMVGGIATFDDISHESVENLMLTFTAPDFRSIVGEPIQIRPTGPTGLHAWGGNGRIRLRWDPHPDAVGYVVYADSMTGVTPMSVTGSASPGVDYCEIGLSEDDDRYYVVSTLAFNGEGGYSDEAMGTAIGDLDFDDPLLGDQWHIDNTGQGPGDPCEDADVQPAWEAGYDGSGVRVVVVDTGTEIAHEDLSENVIAGQSYNYVSDMYGDPTGGNHGTAVTGIIVAERDNATGVSGIAPGAGFVAYNLLQALTDENEADAMSRDRGANAISSNSWGPADGFGRLESPGSLWRAAVDQALAEGRGGLGTIFLWAGGNGGDEDFDPPDDSNYDGYANARGINAICAVGDDGVRAPYSEKGANLLVCGPSEGGSGQGITTTDRTGGTGYDSTNYTDEFNGTSAATPMVSGVVALMLDAEPTLTWRDVREILARSARMNDPTDPDWTWNAATPPLHINHSYGFGVVDAGAAVELAEGWTPVAGAIETFSTATQAVNLVIPDSNATGVSSTINVSGSGIDFIEFIEIQISIVHTYTGDLRIVLTSPGGTESVLAYTRVCSGSCGTINTSWRYSSVRQLGEAADGMWRLRVIDGASIDVGTFQNWRLHFYGR